MSVSTKTDGSLSLRFRDDASRPQVMSRIDLQTVRVTDTKVQFCGTRRYFRCPSAANGIKCQERFEKRGIRGVL